MHLLLTLNIHITLLYFQNHTVDIWLLRMLFWDAFKCVKVLYDLPFLLWKLCCSYHLFKSLEKDTDNLMHAT